MHILSLIICIVTIVLGIILFCYSFISTFHKITYLLCGISFLFSGSFLLYLHLFNKRYKSKSGATYSGYGTL